MSTLASGSFQLATYGFAAYVPAVSYSLGTRVDFTQLIKIYEQAEQGGGERRLHKTIRCTPAMEAGIAKSVWELKDLLAY